MIVAAPTSDPYPTPFEWSDAMEAEAPEERLFNLLPCEFQCEYGGWLPLPNGTAIACPSCQSVEPQ